MVILTAKQQSLHLSDIIAQVESGGNAHAIRFEPSIFDSLTNGAMSDSHAAIVSRIQRIHRCTQKTAQVIYSTSYGLYQLMGFNLYADDTVNSTDFDVINFCVTLSEQTRLFAQFIAKARLNFSPAQLAESPYLRVRFGNIYNGNGVSYAQGIVAALKHFDFQVSYDGNYRF